MDPDPDLNTFKIVEVLGIEPPHGLHKAQKDPQLNMLEQFEIYNIKKTHKNEILSD